MADFHQGDQVCVVAECSRKGQIGVVRGVSPIQRDGYQIWIIEFEFGSETLREHYFDKELIALGEMPEPS